MGAFFTNVQVRGTETDALVRALREDAKARGMDEVEDGADRVVLILPPEKGWVTVYDEATEGQNKELLDGLARLVTKATGTLGFSVLVHDSDVLDLHLYRGGTSVDHLDTNPSYWGPVSKKKAASLSGDPRAWGELADTTKIAEVFQTKQLFAERTLERVAELVGLDRRRALRGYRADSQAPNGALTLRFRARLRPSWEQDAGGPPGLEADSHHETLTLAVPDKLHVGFTARSTGAASTGLEIRVWGSALDRGAVTIDRFEVVLGDPRRKANRVTLEAESARSTDGKLIRSAKSPDLCLPSGFASLQVFMPPGVDEMKMHEAIVRSSVHVNVLGRCIAPGEGEIGVALIPLAHPSAMAAAVTKVAVSAPIARPLRFDGDLASAPRGESGLLRPLVGDRWHIALIVSDRPRRELTELAREMIEDARFVIGSGEVRATIFNAEPGTKAESGRGKTSTRLVGKRLESLLEAMRTEQRVEVAVSDAAARAEGTAHFGIALGTGVSPHYEEERVPAISAWLDSNRPGAAAVIDRWGSRFDVEMQSGRGVQAMITRASSQPHGESTAYEDAVGIARGAGSMREWVTRWLRVPGRDRTWLSAQLAAHVTNRAALGEVAVLEPLGDALRIALRDGAEFSALERALEAILPSRTESHAAVRGFFARHKLH